MNCGWGISYEIALRWMPLDLTDDESTLAQVMAWCRQATSHYLSQCWPRSMSTNGVTRPQWVNWTRLFWVSHDANRCKSPGFNALFWFKSHFIWGSLSDFLVSFVLNIVCDICRLRCSSIVLYSISHPLIAFSSRNWWSNECNKN